MWLKPQNRFDRQTSTAPTVLSKRSGPWSSTFGYLQTISNKPKIGPPRKDCRPCYFPEEPTGTPKYCAGNECVNCLLRATLSNGPRTTFSTSSCGSNRRILTCSFTR